VELGGVHFQTCEVVKEAQSRGVERTGGGSDHWHEPVVLGLKYETLKKYVKYDRDL